MFTGLVEGLGTIVEFGAEAPAVRLLVAPPREMLAGSSVGDSVAINGCCLTIVAVETAGWTIQAGPETLARTNLGASASATA